MLYNVSKQMKPSLPNTNRLSELRDAALGACSNKNVHDEIVALSSQKANSNCDQGLKRRGRKAAAKPTVRHLQVLIATKTHTYAEVGAKFDLSRQRIGQIVRRWKQYLPTRSLPLRAANESKEASCPKVKKENRTHIVSFRLTNSEVQLLQTRYPEMKSVDKAARGIVTKFLSL